MNTITALALHEALKDTVEIKDLFTGRGTHEGCGECCSRFMPLTEGEVKVIRREIMLRGIKPRFAPKDVIDLTCPLLDEDKRCMIYDFRPCICRVYDCSKHKNGTIPLPPLIMKRAEIVDMRKVVRV
jgi:hypothetical protein